MSLILVPHSITQNAARIWMLAAAEGHPPRDLVLSLMPEDRNIRVPRTGWRESTAGGALPANRRPFIQTVSIGQLQPNRRYRIVAKGGNSPAFSTLPEELPAPGNAPFSILLSSCFYRPNDRPGLVGGLAGKLPPEFKPCLKFLCGDQVYLDAPVFNPFRDEESWLATDFMQKYLGTWSDRSSGRLGYQILLENGGTYFTADDHEFWNNYPNWTTLIPNTWSEGGRQRWKRVALALFQDFQAESAEVAGRPRQFQVGKLSFFVADTRVFRREGDLDFMPADAIASLEEWVRSLVGPGVLVVGQPLFHNPSGWLAKRFEDRALSNYRQYKRLVRTLFQSKHSILLLTGDVHYGRVSVCELNPSARPVRLIEVIASPASLVNPLVGGKSEDAPPLFPPLAVPGIVQQPVHTMYRTAENHFATLHFNRTGNTVSFVTRFWFPGRRVPEQTRSEEIRPLQLL